MKAETIWTKLVDILCSELGVDADAITEDAHLYDDLHAEELDMVEIVMRCEETFKIAIDDDRAAGLMYVRDLFHHLTRRLARIP